MTEKPEQRPERDRERERTDKSAKQEEDRPLLAGGLDPNDTPQQEIPGSDPTAEDYDPEKDPTKVGTPSPTEK